MGSDRSEVGRSPDRCGRVRNYRDGVTRFLLVRHGQSIWNELGRWQGQADPPLSDLGRHQAKTAARSIGTVDLIVASTLERARDTAGIISTELGIGPVIELDTIMERDAGEWSGLTRDEIDVAYPNFLAEGRRPPGWETDEQLRDRVFGTLDALAAKVADGDVLIVTHGGVIMAVEDHLGGGHHRIANLGGRWIDGRDGTLTLGPRLDLLDGADVTVPDQI